MCNNMPNKNDIVWVFDSVEHESYMYDVSMLSLN